MTSAPVANLFSFDFLNRSPEKKQMVEESVTKFVEFLPHCKISILFGNFLRASFSIWQ